MTHLLPQATATFHVGADVIKFSLEAGLQQIAPKAAAQAGLDVECLDDQHKWRCRQGLHHRRIDDVQCRLVDQTDLRATFLQRNYRIQRAIYGLSERHDVTTSRLRLANHIVLAGLKWRALIQWLAVAIENIRYRSARRKNESQTWIAINALDTRCELMLIHREVQPRGVLAMARLYAAIGKHAVDAKVTGIVTHVIHTAVAEMRHHVRKIEACHRNFADAHLEERAERRINALLTGSGPKACGG